MTIKVTEEKINEKLKRGEETIGAKVIKYPHFESEKGMAGEKLCKKMNGFYKDIAMRFSLFADRKLPLRTKAVDGKIKVGMKYMVSACNDEVICIVIDLAFFDGRGAQKRRFSQIWSIKKGEMLPIGEVLRTDILSRKKVLSLVLSAADKNDKSGGFGYFDGVLTRLRRCFSIFNCFLVADGVCFFVDAGKLSPSGYGAECFIIPKKELVGIIRGNFYGGGVEDCK